MHTLHPFHIIVLLCTSFVVADYLTGSYPPPLDLTSDQSLVAATWKDISSGFDQYLIQKSHEAPKDLAESKLDNVTFSLGVFSLHDMNAIKLQYHHTGPEVANAKNGTNKVDGDSIYMIASVSKLITTYVGMIRLSLEDWNKPLTELNPYFKEYFNGNANPIWTIEWDKLTLSALAAQLSGLPTTGVYTPSADLYNPNETALYGAPLVDLSKWSKYIEALSKDAANLNYVSMSDAISTIANIPPNFKPWTTPAYSDLNFMLLGNLISNITNQSMPALYHDTVFSPLGMLSSNMTASTDPAFIAHAVLPSLISSEPSFFTPSGGILSTVHDLQRLGIGILNNTLLSPETTRKWMKPVSHTASLTNSVGSPWEIHRYIHPGTTKVTDIYSKLGSSDSWGGVLVLIPEYNAGFAMLNEYTGKSRGKAATTMIDYVVNKLVPGLDAQAAAEVNNNLVGTYNCESVPDTSVTITYRPTSYGTSNSPLLITQWTYNGTDVLKGPFFNASTGAVHLEPSISNAKMGQAGQIAFQASSNANYLTYVDAMKDPKSGVIGPFTGFQFGNPDFTEVDYDRWAGVGADLFVFDIDANRKATALTPAVDRVKLIKVQ